MDTAKRKQLRAIGHKLKPVVMIAERGVTEGVEAELERALEAVSYTHLTLPTIYSV